jgi:hypothetical protein
MSCPQCLVLSVLLAVPVTTTAFISVLLLVAVECSSDRKSSVPLHLCTSVLWRNTNDR